MGFRGHKILLHGDHMSGLHCMPQMSLLQLSALGGGLYQTSESPGSGFEVYALRILSGWLGTRDLLPNPLRKYI